MRRPSNVVPVVGELIADGGRDFEPQNPALSAPTAGGTNTLASHLRGTGPRVPIQKAIPGSLRNPVVLNIGI